MKKVICFCLLGLLILMRTSSFARNLEKGTFEIGGAMDLSVSSFESSTEGSDKMDEDSKTIQMSGYYYPVNDIGLGFSLTYDENDSSSDGENFESKLYIIGPALSFNFSLDTKLSMKFQGAIGFIRAESDSYYYKTSTKGEAWQLNGMLCYYINENVSVDCFLGIVSYEMDREVSEYGYEYQDEMNGFRSGLGLTAYF